MVLSIHKYEYVGYQSLDKVSTDDVARLVSSYNRQASQPANDDDPTEPFVLRHGWPTHKLVLAGLTIDNAKDAIVQPDMPCGTIAWIGSGTEISRPSNSKVFVTGQSAYFICTWTDIFGHSRHGKHSDMRFQTNNNMYYFVGKLAPEATSTIIAELAEYVNRPYA